MNRFAFYGVLLQAAFTTGAAYFSGLSILWFFAAIAWLIACVATFGAWHGDKK